MPVRHSDGENKNASGCMSLEPREGMSSPAPVLRQSTWRSWEVLSAAGHGSWHSSCLLMTKERKQDDCVNEAHKGRPLVIPVVMCVGVRMAT